MHVLITFFLIFPLIAHSLAYADSGKTNTPARPTLLQAKSNPWYQQAAKAIHIQDTYARTPPAVRGAAKNIILFLGDGMGVSTITAARILDGQQKGLQGEENTLSFEHFPHTALSKTYNVDAQTPDSAGTMTAIMSGVKTDMGIVGLAEGVTRGVCESRKGQRLLSALELAELSGLATGIVTTSRITHATPAATYAESVERNWETNSTMPVSAIADGCEDIASQLLSFSQRLNEKAGTNKLYTIDVLFGGGSKNFLPLSATFEGNRTDGRNLINEWQALNPTGAYISTNKDFKTLNKESTSPVLGLFSPSHLHYKSQRSDQPSLTEMTTKAVELLQNNTLGFFLVVEGARIDHAHHSGNAYNALEETIELSKAVESAVKMTDPEETLIVVTADHSHVFTIAGYPKRGNPILGKVISPGRNSPELSSAGLPYTTLGYANGPGFKPLKKTGVMHTDIREINTEAPHYQQASGIPLASETHGAEDVAIYASGPGSHLVAGTMEQNRIFHILEFAGDLMNKAQKSL